MDRKTDLSKHMLGQERAHKDKAVNLKSLRQGILEGNVQSISANELVHGFKDLTYHKLSKNDDD